MKQVVLVLAAAIIFPSCASAAYKIAEANDITYGYGVINADKPADQWEKVALKVDVRYPEGDTKNKKTLLMYVHGGGFSGTLKTDVRKHRLFNSLAKEFVPKGYVVMSIEYRLRQDVPLYPASIDWNEPLYNLKIIKPREVHAAIRDAKAAVRWVRAEGAKKFGIDPEKICLIGTSAGAMTVLGVTVNQAGFLNDGPKDPCVKQNHPEQSSTPNACFEISGSIFKELEKDFDPNDPPIAIWHGTDDVLVPVKGAYTIERLCQENKIPNEYCIIEGAKHVPWLSKYKNESIFYWIEKFVNDSFDKKNSK